ncbi:ABC transporter substrate-binding protein [Natrinema salaciae]|uniref:ABC transporter substrate-binding protein n=1 Tax=Natrinema salaciae TaxID=1186196 RepID=UPI00373FDBFC
MTRRGALSLGAAGLAGTAGCLGSGTIPGFGSEDHGSYTIGMVNSESGTLAAFGRRNERGLRSALTAINAAGIGPSNEPLVVEVENDRSSETGGVDAARRLVEQVEVPVLVGTVGSGITERIHQDVVSGTDVVQISQNSTSSSLSDYPDLLRTAPSSNTLGAALANQVSEDGHETVALTWIDNAYGKALSEVFVDAFDGTVASNDPHPAGGSSFESELSSMADTDATAWVFLTYADEFTVMITEAYEQNYHEAVDYYGAESTIAEEILAGTPEGSQEGLTGITESAPVDQENYQQFRDEYRSIWGMDPTVWAAYTYDAVVLSAIALEAAETATGSAIGDIVREITVEPGDTVTSFQEAKAALADGGPEDINYDGVSGPLALDENGDPKGFYQVFEVVDHDYEFGSFISG